jgi:uncharacterized 2Fe-2S/4Fe-4S cluster protein (DUF4445 family)
MSFEDFRNERDDFELERSADRDDWQRDANDLHGIDRAVAATSNALLSDAARSEHETIVDEIRAAVEMVMADAFYRGETVSTVQILEAIVERFPDLLRQLQLSTIRALSASIASESTS